MAKIDHLRYRRFVDAYVDGELHGALADRVARHVDTCPMCGPDAEVTVRIKHSLARRRTLPDRAADLVGRWRRRHRATGF